MTLVPAPCVRAGPAVASPSWRHRSWFHSPPSDPRSRPGCSWPDWGPTASSPSPGVAVTGRIPCPDRSRCWSWWTGPTRRVSCSWPIRWRPSSTTSPWGRWTTPEGGAPGGGGRPERPVLVGAHLDEEPPARSQEPGAGLDHPADDVEAVGPPVEGEAGFVALDVGRQEPELGGGDVGGDGGDDVEDMGPQGPAEVGPQGEHTVAPGTGHRNGVDLDGDHGGGGDLGGQVGGDGSRPSAQVDGPSLPAGEEPGGPAGQL